MHSFSLNHGFIPLSFSDKVLMRHILNEHPRGSAININSGCPNSDWVNVLYYYVIELSS